MIHGRSPALLAFFALLATARCYGLDWAETQLTAKVRPGAAVATATYHFVNSSKAVVHINGVKTECGCTEATPSASEIPAGQPGTIDVVFNAEKRYGHQHKEILVETSDAKEPVKLTLDVDLPEKKVNAKK
jgi:hypothetical protein